MNLVFVTTRHDSHARYAAEALRAGKSVFVEKPLALNNEELEAILSAYAEAGTGRNCAAFNGRLQPAFFRAGPCHPAIVCWADGTAGHALSHQRRLRTTHALDAASRSGRTLHRRRRPLRRRDAISLWCTSHQRLCRRPTDRARRYNNDNVLVSITFADGSVGTIHYLANGANAMEKEYLEVSGESKTARMWNFKKLESAVGRKKSSTSFSGDKGHAAEMKALLDGFESGTGSPVSIESLAATSRATFAAMESLRMNCVVQV